MPNTQTGRIVGAAAQLFASRGYAAVSMADIADRIGLTPGNLYRYVPGKNALLHEVFDAALELCEAERGAPCDLDVLLDRSLAAATSQPAEIAAYLRERRRVDATAFPQIARRDRAFVRQWVAAICAHQTNDARDRTATRLQAILGVLDAITELPSDVGARTRGAIGAGAHAIVTASLPLPALSTPVGARRWRPPRTRRQQIIDAAVSLFGERGFDDVRVIDVGRAIGISGPSVYEYFRTKQHILVAAFDRCAALLVSSASGALDEASDPGDALQRLAHGLARICVANRDAMAMTAREIAALDDADRERVSQLRVDLDDIWAAVAREQWPDMPAPKARAIARSAIQLTMHATRSVESTATPEEIATMTLAFIEAGATHSRDDEGGPSSVRELGDG